MDAAELVTSVMQSFAPPPNITGSAWADTFRVVAGGPYPGKWHTSRTPQLKEPLDCATSPDIEGIVIIKPTRMGGTEVINCAMGYYIHYDPCDIMYVQSSLDSARKYESRILMPLVYATPVLRERITNRIAGRKSTSTRISKSFPGGALDLVGAKSPHSFTMLSKRVVILDDVNKYEHIKSGDPIELAIGRAKDFWNKKIILVSNPGTDGECPIQPYFMQTNQQYRYVPCPLCGEFQILKFGGKDLDFGIKWNDQGDVWYLCEHCHGKIHESAKVEMDKRGEWRAHGESQLSRWVGFSLNPFLCGWHSWKTEFVDRFMVMKGQPDKLKVFVTERLGEWWKAYKKETSYQKLYDRREEYPAEVPRGVLAITIGADVQGDRIEAEAVGYGREYESWKIERKIFYGNPAEDDVWRELDKFLQKTWRHESGIQMGAVRVFIDSGDGNVTQKVYDFTTAREIRGVYSCKGENRRGQAVFSRWSQVNNKHTKLAFVGTDSAKDCIQAWLGAEAPGPGYMHFPISYDNIDYYKQLVSEYKNDKGFWTLKAGQHNEGLDTSVYSFAALQSLAPDWDELERNIGVDNYAYRVFNAYDTTKHLDEKILRNENLPIILCVNFNADPCVWLLAQSDGKKIWVFDEIALRGADAIRMVRELKRHYDIIPAKNPKGIIVYAPPGQKTNYTLLFELGLRTQRYSAKDTDLKTRLGAINNLLENSTGESRITIHPRCVMLRKDLEKCAWAENGEDIERAAGRGNAVETFSHYAQYEWPLRFTRPNSSKMFYK